MDIKSYYKAVVISKEWNWFKDSLSISTRQGAQKQNCAFMDFLCIAKYTLQVSIEYSGKWYSTHGYAYGKTQSDYYCIQYVKINFKEIQKIKHERKNYKHFDERENAFIISAWEGLLK